MKQAQILEVLKKNVDPIDKNVLHDILKEMGDISYNAYRIHLTRLRKEKLIRDIDKSVVFTDTTELKKQAILKTLEGKTLEDIKDMLVRVLLMILNKEKIKK